MKILLTYKSQNQNGILEKGEVILELPLEFTPSLMEWEWDFPHEEVPSE